MNTLSLEKKLRAALSQLGHRCRDRIIHTPADVHIIIKHILLLLHLSDTSLGGGSRALVSESWDALLVCKFAAAGVFAAGFWRISYNLYVLWLSERAA